jgi:hypothetical protein
MPAMKRLALGISTLIVACGPSLEPDRVKTPDEIIAEQEALGGQQLAAQRNSDDYADTTEATEDEKRRQWDARQADLEMRRAARSAESCPESVTEKAPKGRAGVTLVFGNDGRVKSASVAEPYSEENAVGKCVLRAMKAVIVPAYEGSEHTVNWEVDLTGAKKSGPAGGDAKEE